jgi:hypothetical protein
MRPLPALLLTSCASAATSKPARTSGETGDTGTGPTTETTGYAPTRTSPTPTGECGWLDSPGAPLGAEVRALDPGADYLPIPIGTTFAVIADAAALAAWSSEHGFPVAPDAVDFDVERAVIATHHDHSTCGISLDGVDGWVEGGVPRVDVRIRDTGHGCYSPCDSGGGLIVLVAVPSEVEPTVCVRVGGGCDDGFRAAPGPPPP